MKALWFFRKAIPACVLLFSLFFIPLFSAAQATEGFTLQQCLDYAYANNINVQKVQLAVESARWNRRQAVAELIPTVSGNVNHSFNFGLRFDQTSGQLQDQQFQNSFMGLSSSWVIFNGLSNYARIGQNKYSYLAAQADFNQALDDLALNIVDLFMQVLFADERLKILVQQEDVLRQQVERNNILYEAGAITRSDLLSIQSQLATQEVQVVNGQNALTLAKLSLIQALNLEKETIDIVAPNLDSIAIEPLSESINVQSVYNKALMTRASIIAGQYRIRSSEKALTAARGGYYPSLTFNASVGTSFSELRKDYTNPLDPITIPFGDQLRQNNSQQVTFGMSIPLFNGLQIRNAVQQSKISMLNTKLDLEQAKQNIRNTIQRAYADAQTAYRTYQTNISNLSALEESFMYAKEKLEAGAINSVEFADASYRYFNAKTELLIARFDYIFKTKVLDFYNGKPLELK